MPKQIDRRWLGLRWVLVAALTLSALGIGAGSASANTTVASGMIVFPIPGKPSPDEALFIAQGCATNVTTGMTDAVVNVRAYGGRTMVFRSLGSQLPDQPNSTNVNVAAHKACDANSPATLLADRGTAASFRVPAGTVYLRLSMTVIPLANWRLEVV